MSDIKEKLESFSEYKIYEGIFNIFEQELKEISNFVAFSDGNMGVYSNKIHELHLRVCSEIENILKIVIHQHFLSKKEVKELWRNEKSAFLKDKNLVKEYEELKGKFSSKKEREKLEKLLYGYPDFLFYFKIACEKFKLDKKVVKFKIMVSQSSTWNKIQSFKTNEDVPYWWTHYNSLKHDKIKKYNICTLGDLISSMSGMFILMTYLLKYQRDNCPIKNHDYIHWSQNSKMPYVDTSFFYFPSNLFEASVVQQSIVWAMILPLDVNNFDYHNKDIIHLKSSISAYSIFCNHDNQTIKNVCLESFDHGDISNIQESIFYTYVDYQNFTTNDGTEFWRLQHYARFSN
jgi:hypothetical protein